MEQIKNCVFYIACKHLNTKMIHISFIPRNNQFTLLKYPNETDLKDIKQRLPTFLQQCIPPNNKHTFIVLSEVNKQFTWSGYLYLKNNTSHCNTYDFMLIYLLPMLISIHYLTIYTNQG